MNRSSTVYRDQGILNAKFENLRKKFPRGLFSFNVFLSTSVDESGGKRFAGLTSVPFTPVKDLSAIPGEEEILLSLTSDVDPLLQRLTDHMRLSLGGGNEWRRMAQLMLKMGEFDKAMGIYQMLLEKVDRGDKAEPFG